MKKEIFGKSCLSLFVSLSMLGNACAPIFAEEENNAEEIVEQTEVVEETPEEAVEDEPVVDSEEEVEEDDFVEEIIESDNESYSGTCGTNLKWTLSNGVLTISGTGAMKDYIYNSTYNAPWRYKSAKTVIINSGATSIGSGAFFGELIEKVTIPSTVTSIRYDAFGQCFYLKTINLPNSIKTIGIGAFSSCEALSSITLPSSLTTISDYLFEYCTSLKSITIPDKVTSIGQYAFRYCTSLTTVTIPKSVTSIKTGAFQNCKNIKDVYYAGSKESWNKISFGSDNSYLKNATIHFGTPSNAMTYKIKYVMNGGTNHTSNPTSYTNYGSTVTLQTPTRTGYTFKGWYSDSKYTNRVTNIYPSDGKNYTLYAKWEAINYSISYSLNGGTNNTANPSTYTIAKAVALKIPTRSGYTFAGWYADSSFTTKVTSIKKGLTGTQRVYAKWNIITYKISYKLNGGTNSTGNATSYTVATDTLNLYTPTRTGYKFMGWYSDAKFTNKVTTVPKGSTGNKVFYAKWEAIQYSISYSLNGGTNNTANPSTYTIAKAVALKTPTRNGYKFMGWYADSSFTTKVTAIKKGSIGTQRVYAKWQIVNYTIKYVLNGGTNSTSNPKSYTVTSSVTLANPSRAGFEFLGWYKDSKYTTKVTSISKGTTGTVVLYAKWNKVDTSGDTIQLALNAFKAGNYSKYQTYMNSLSKIASESCTKNMSSEMKTAYKNFINKKIVERKQINEDYQGCYDVGYFEYALTDFDNDGNADLIISSGWTPAQSGVYLYQYKNGTVKK